MDAWKNARAIETIQEEIKDLKANIVRIMNIVTATAPKKVQRAMEAPAKKEATPNKAQDDKKKGWFSKA